MAKIRKRTHIKTVEVENPEHYPVRCPGCKKTPRNCVCYEYRIETVKGNPSISFVYVDNVATEPVRGQEVRTWQARANARIWRAPTFIDGYGPVMYVDDDEDLIVEILEAINDKTFRVGNYDGRGGCRIRTFERDLARRLPFLRAPRKRRSSKTATKIVPCT